MTGQVVELLDADDPPLGFSDAPANFVDRCVLGSAVVSFDDVLHAVGDAFRVQS